MQDLKSFLSANKIGGIKFYPSTKQTGRFVGSANGITFVTVKEFDSKKPTFVVDDPGKPEEGILPDNNLKFLTNKQATEAAFTLG